MEMREKIFLEGVTAGELGLPASVCPYPYLDEPIFTGEEITLAAAPANWATGWNLGKMKSILALRSHKRGDVISGISALLEKEHEFSLAWESIENGLLKSRLDYFSAKEKLKDLRVGFSSNPNIELLDHLRLKAFWQVNRWGFADELLGRVGHNSEEWIRQLVSYYGEKHGVKLVWSTYIRESSYLSDIIEDLRNRNLSM